MAHEPHGAQVEHRGRAPGAYGGQRLLGRLEQARPGRGRGAWKYGMPGRCCSTAAGQPRGVRVLMPRPLSSQTSSTGQSRCTCVRYAAALKRACRRRVVDRGVAEARDDQRVLRPRRLPAQRLRESQGEAEPDRARQVRGDRRGLRDDVQLGVAEHLVPAARDRVGGRAGQAPERLADRVDAPVQVRAGGVERPRAVVQQRGVGGRATAARSRRCDSCPAEPIV